MEILYSRDIPDTDDMCVYILLLFYIVSAFLCEINVIIIIIISCLAGSPPLLCYSRILHTIIHTVKDLSADIYIFNTMAYTSKDKKTDNVVLH